jgi:hypothetical protein
MITQTITQFTNEYTARIELTPKEIIYNKPHPAILLRIPDKLVRFCILVLVQEIKRNCSVSSPRRPHVEYKRMVLEHTHGLFIT